MWKELQETLHCLSFIRLLHFYDIKTWSNLLYPFCVWMMNDISNGVNTSSWAKTSHGCLIIVPQICFSPKMYLTNQNPNLPIFFHGKICLLNLIVGISQGSGHLRDSTLAAKLIHSPAAGLLHNTIKYYMHLVLPSLAYLVVMLKPHFFSCGLDNRSECLEEEIFGLSATLTVLLFYQGLAENFEGWMYTLIFSTNAPKQFASF